MCMQVYASVVAAFSHGKVDTSPWCIHVCSDSLCVQRYSYWLPEAYLGGSGVATIFGPPRQQLVWAPGQGG